MKAIRPERTQGSLGTRARVARPLANRCPVANRSGSNQIVTSHNRSDRVLPIAGGSPFAGPHQSAAIELAGAPPILFLAGLCGVGKSYVGEIIERRMGFFRYEADDDVTPDMRHAMAHGEPFTEAMRDEFFEIVLERIAELSKIHDRLVITQAAYKRRHRALLQEVPGLKLLWVDAPKPIILRRLRESGSRLASLEYALTIWKNFETPPSKTPRIWNVGGEEEIVLQLVELFGAPSEKDLEYGEVACF